MPIACEQTRVIKKLSPHQAGAIKLARRYGDALVCVRYRYDAQGLTRYTTIELLVDEMPVAKRGEAMRVVAIKLPPRDQTLRQLVIDSGGKWDTKARVWNLAVGTVRRLKLGKWMERE